MKTIILSLLISISVIKIANSQNSLLPKAIKFNQAPLIEERVIDEPKITTPATNDKVYLDFVGSGDIQKSISKGDDISANTGIGIIFERYNSPKRYVQSLEIDGYLNIASTTDSIQANIKDGRFLNRRDFGSYVLNPISTKQSLYANSNIYFGYPDSGKQKYFSFFSKYVFSGINLRFIASNNVWVRGDSISNLGVLYFRGGLFKEFIPDNYRLGKAGTDDEGRSKYSIFLGLHYSYRKIIGDITGDKHVVLREQILGSRQQKFKGCEFNVGFRLNNIRVEFQMPILKKEKDYSSIEGLTDSQFLFSIKFVGGFGLKLNTDKEDTKAAAAQPSPPLTN